jgi:hypothetical protein
MDIPIHKIDTVSLYVILKARSIINAMLKDCLYITGLMISLFSGSKLKSLN